MLGSLEVVTYYMKAKLNRTEITRWQGPVIEIYGMIKTAVMNSPSISHTTETTLNRVFY